ncbi:MAG: amino acid ABC transporter substrate-binding protein [Thermodesulfobacteriota bacterium]|nr:amino acid ABC transporter substrate-binding protein [Thermodesulfobacteriota bacterium]
MKAQKKGERWKGVFAGFAILTFLFGLSLVEAPGAERPFKIGFTVPLTGAFGKDGALVKDAYIFWKEAANAQGGIEVKKKRHPVELIFYDDKSEPTSSAKLVEKLITEDKVDLILGGFGSSQVIAASAVSEKYRYPMTCGAASTLRLFDRGFKYYFSLLGKAPEEVRGCVEILPTLSPRPETVAIIGANIPFCADAADGFKAYAEKLGMKVVHFELFPLALIDYNTLLMKVKDKNPDVLLVGSHSLVAMRVMKGLKEVDFTPKGVFFSYGPTVPDFVDSLGKDAEYVFAASEWTPNLPYRDRVFGTARDFHNQYVKRFGRAPDFVEAASVAGALVQQQAVQELGLTPPLKDPDREKIMQFLYSKRFDNFYGPIRFAADGANEIHPPVVVQVQGGKLVHVFPPDTAEGKPIYPMKPWKKR